MGPVKILENLYQSALIEDWQVILKEEINIVIDLEGTVDMKIPQNIIYIYWAIEDGPLPDTNILWGIASFGAQMLKAGYKVLSHCVGGYNRSGLMNACIIKKLNPNLHGKQIIEIIRNARPGALSNPTFVDFVKEL